MKPILDANLSKTLFENKILVDFLKPKIDPWNNTPLKGYVNINNKVKGKYGELFVELMMKQFGHTVGKAKKTNAGHDRIINGFLTEVKFGAAHRNDQGSTIHDTFSFNHFSVKKDWQRAIVIGVNIDCNPYAVWFDKTDFINMINKSDVERKYFKRQQSGKNGGNDDWMFMTDTLSWNKFINEPWVKSIEEW
jgi:hypothetical protein